MDVTKFLADFSAGDPATKMRLGQARVRSVDSDPTYTIASGQAVIVPTSQEWGTSEIVANYLGEYPPRPGGSCWYVTDGVDRIILGMVAPDGPPAASIELTAATATTTATISTVAMTTVSYDPWNMTDTVGTGLTIPVGGMYAITGFQTYGANATGFRQITLRRNGTNLESVRLPTTSASNPIINLTMPGYPLNKGDIISMIGQQTSGGNLNMNAASLSVQYVGRRRSTSGTATLIADGSFENNDITTAQSAWDFTNATSATWSLDPSFTGHYDGVAALKGVHVAGTVSTVVQSNTVIPVVPRQKLRLSAYVQANALMPASATVGAQFLLLTSADGTPVYLETGTTATTAGTSLLTTSFLPISQDVTVPTGAFVARIGLRTMSTSANTVQWDAIVATEIIS
jgi:hypothetical protein